MYRGFCAKGKNTCAKHINSPYLQKNISFQKGVSMDKEIWSIITKMVVSVNRSLERTGRRCRYSDVLIVRMYLWAVWHDRPMFWACDRRNYGTLFRPARLPSVSQFCRRLKTKRIGQMIQAIHERLTQSNELTKLSFFDGKALPISRHSRDKDAKKGYADGSFRRGYKLHVWATQDGRIPRFRVLPMNCGEPNTARELTDLIPGGSLVLADANYDSGKLYQAVDDRDSQLLTPLKGMAQSPRQLRRMPSARRRAIELWKLFDGQCKELLKLRYEIERIFSAVTCFGGGLSPLPTWVRRLSRVERWVSAKLIFYHARLILRKAAI
jgi:hypothetical protein